MRSLLGELDFASSPDETCSSGSDETSLLTAGSVPSGGCRVTNVLMITTTVRMLNRVHRDTTNLRPGVTLDLVLVEGVTSLQDRLLDTTATSDDTDNGTGTGVQFLTGTRRELDQRALSVLGVAGDDARASAAQRSVLSVAHES